MNQPSRIGLLPLTLPEGHDLPDLDSTKGARLAGVLSDILAAVDYDRLNQKLRPVVEGGDYPTSPFPLNSAEIHVHAMREVLQMLHATPNYRIPVTDRVKAAFEFFMFGDSISRRDLEVLFGRSREKLIDDFLEIGLFLPQAGGKIRMNGVSVASKQLPNGKVVYVLADTPPYFPNRLNYERVYIGDDSYCLMDRVLRMPVLSGVIAETGSGSGIQLIAAVKLFPTIQKAIGLEIDQRAINVSRFNCFLNGVADKIKIVDTPENLKRELGDERISFAMSNPPFLPMPDEITISAEDAEILSDRIAISKTSGEPRMSLRGLFAKAGWGGTDGLDVTRQFLDILKPLMAENATIVVFSCFAGREAETGPTKIAELVNSFPGWSVDLEPTPTHLNFENKTGNEWPVMSENLVAEQMMLKLLAQRPELRTEGVAAVLKRQAIKIQEAFRNDGITNFFEGYAVIDTGSPGD